MKFFSLVISGFVLSGCGSQQPAPDATECGANEAMIWVQDGGLSRVCGCKEGAGSTTETNAELICTLGKPAKVSFLFSGTENRHQILSEGEPSFVSSGVSDPDQKITSSPSTPHVVELTQSGRYKYKDVFLESSKGQIRVE